jgi:hypothetical protein
MLMVRCAVGTPLLKALSNPSLACENDMAATPEAKVKAKVVKQLKELGAYYFSPVTGGYGRSGVPDIVVCINGRFVGIECKAGKGVTTALQEKNLEAIRQSGGKAFVLNEENVDSLTALLRIMGMLNEK